tara:strand:- start:413 stop:1066 length:654 start_codon:yes stop_codon:yes gene_type:complete
MKKTITILLSFLFISFQAAKADIGVGITGAYHMFDASGNERTRQSNQINNGSHSDEVIVPELFIEGMDDNGFTIGFSYIPTRDVGSKSRTDSNSDGDSGTYTAKAELDNVVQIYVDVPLVSAGAFPIHGKLGVQHATIVTLESLNSGSTYPDQDVLGVTIGLGTKGDLPYGNNLYYKVEATYTDFEEYSNDSTSSPQNRVTADLEDTAVKFSIGTKF